MLLSWVVAALDAQMPKKKNTSRQGAGDDSAQEGGHEEASGASISAACGLPPQPIPSAPDQDDSAEDTSRPADGEGTSSLPSGMIVAGTSETRYISCVPYCDGMCVLESHATSADGSDSRTLPFVWQCAQCLSSTVNGALSSRSARRTFRTIGRNISRVFKGTKSSPS